MHVEISPINGVPDLVNPVDHAGECLVQARLDEIGDFDELQPADQPVEGVLDFVARLAKRPAGDGVRRPLTLA